MTSPGSEPVGAVEIAERLGVRRQTVDNWRQRGRFPDPEWTVGGRPAWRWSTIDNWHRGRTARLTTVETDCLVARAQEIAAAALGCYVGGSQAGRLGTELAFSDPDDAATVAGALQDSGYKTIVSPG